MTAPTSAIGVNQRMSRNVPKTVPKRSEQRRGRAAQSVSPDEKKMSSRVAAAERPPRRHQWPLRDRPESRDEGGRARGDPQRSGGAPRRDARRAVRSLAAAPVTPAKNEEGREGTSIPFPLEQIPSAMTVSTLGESLSSSLGSSSCRRSRRPPSRPPPSSSSSRRSVRFGTVEIREYPFALGDNPSVAAGPPLTVAWDRDPSFTFLLDVDAYETDKPTPRGKHEIVRPQWDREEILFKMGYSRGQIKEAVRDVNRAKARRARTARRTVHVDKLEAAFESLCRKVRRAMRCGMGDVDAYQAWVEGRELALREMDAKERMATVEVGSGVGTEAENTGDRCPNVDASVSEDQEDGRRSQTSVQEGAKTQECLIPSDPPSLTQDLQTVNAAHQDVIIANEQ